MSYYKLNIKRFDITLELDSIGSRFMAKEFDKWMETILKVSFSGTVLHERHEDDIEESNVNTPSVYISGAGETEKDSVLKVSENDDSLTRNEFQKVLQKKITFSSEISEKIDVMPPVSEEASIIEELINLKNPESMLDYLLITAYYLKEHKQLDRYSLKQINSKIINFTKKPIDHAVIQKAVAKNYIEIVPDFTDVAGVTEYRLTDEGENYLLNVL